jgi:hypothetical protein
MDGASRIPTLVSKDQMGGDGQECDHFGTAFHVSAPFLMQSVRDFWDLYRFQGCSRCIESAEMQHQECNAFFNAPYMVKSTNLSKFCTCVHRFNGPSLPFS